MGLPSQWFQPLQQHGSARHPFQRIAWYLHDAGEQIPDAIMDDIIDNLQMIESGEIVQEQIDKLKKEEDKELGVKNMKKRSAYFRQAYQNVMSEAQIVNLNPTIEDEEKMYFRIRDEIKRLRLEDKNKEAIKKS